jgi:predicted ArsR family transcriptional regulator
MTTRQRILELLQSRRANCAPDLARALQLTPANIRHHLNLLCADGLVIKTGERQTPGRGRPVGVYELASRQDNFSELASLLLETLDDNQADPNDWLCEVAEKLAGAQADPSRHITQRLVIAMQRLESLHYRPRWEAHPGSPDIVFESCPYAEIIEAHPLLCRMDEFLLKTLIGKPCNQTSKLVSNREGNRICRFSVG